jgi:EAL domain-containing protein (putative c-di-GMP-specific phosphodiesterase class I)
VYVVAEGVKRADQLEHLAALGCHEYQGYLLAKPLPAGQFSDLFFFVSFVSFVVQDFLCFPPRPPR